jgi:hypothetical protein
MPALYHPGVVTIIPKYDIGQPNNAANVTQWSTPAVGLSIPQLQAIQTAFDTAWVASWKLSGSSANRYMGSWVIDMSSAVGNQVTNAGYTPVVGSGISTAWGDATACLISLRTLLRYRGGHGRLYIPGLVSTAMNADGHTLGGTASTNMLNMWNNTVAALFGLTGAAGGPLTPIVWHKKLSSNPNSIETVVGVVVQPVLATQRRRQRKVTRRRTRLIPA